MRAPYDLRSQYWPLEEQEMLYKNSNALANTFALIFFNPLVIFPSDQLVITKHPHTRSTRRPVLIPVSSHHKISPISLIFGIRRDVFAPKKSLKLWNAGGADMPASSTANSTRFLTSIPTLGNT